MRQIEKDPRVIDSIAPKNKPYVANLHYCMQRFLLSPATHWLSIDADNPPTANPLELLHLDLDLVGCVTPVWHSPVRGEIPYYLNAYQWRDGHYTPYPATTGLHQVDAIGSGCFLVARRTIEAVAEQQPFARQWGPDGLVTMGCDLSFCRKVKQAGFEVWADFDRPCRHFHEVDLLEVISAFNAWMAACPAPD